MGKNPYVKVSSYEGRKGEVKKVVLLYSGSLNASVLFQWIREEYKAQVVALTVDIGQLTDDLEMIRQKALKLGAVNAYVIDAKDEFCEEYIARGIKANAHYQGGYHLSTPIGRPLLAKWAVKVAAREGADCIAHGASGQGNDQVCIEGAALAINPDIKIIAPRREQTENTRYSYDDNMWGITSEGSEVESNLRMVSLPLDAPDKEEVVELEFVKGIPVALGGKSMKLADIILQLNKRGSKNGVGILHLFQDQVVGLKVCGISEAPAAEIIISAHRDLEKHVSTREENEFKQLVDTKWGYLCYGAKWYEPLFDDLNAFIDKMNQKVTGVVKVRLYKGNCEVVAVETPNSIFDQKPATFTLSTAFNQNASAGFIELYTLQMRMAQRAQKTVLLSVGSRSNKVKLLSSVRKLAQLHYKLYATYKTHKFLKQYEIEAILVNKISQPHLKPNLADLLAANRFDLIVNIPSGTRTKEITDGSTIRRHAIRFNTTLVTSVPVAIELVEKLYTSHEKHIFTS